MLVSVVLHMLEQTQFVIFAKWRITQNSCYITAREEERDTSDCGQTAHVGGTVATAVFVDSTCVGHTEKIMSEGHW